MFSCALHDHILNTWTPRVASCFSVTQGSFTNLSPTPELTQVIMVQRAARETRILCKSLSTDNLYLLRRALCLSHAAWFFFLVASYMHSICISNKELWQNISYAHLSGNYMLRFCMHLIFFFLTFVKIIVNETLKNVNGKWEKYIWILMLKLFFRLIILWVKPFQGILI